MTLFLRMFCGCILQMTPFAFLCLYPFQNHLRFSKRKIVAMTAGLIAVLGVIFAAISCYLGGLFPPGQALFNYANFVFMCCLVPCLGFYLYAVKEIWQKKLFIFMFTLTAALAMTSIGTVIETRLQLGKTMDGLPYYGTALLTLAILTAIVLPLLWLLLKTCYLPVADGLGAKETGALAVLAAVLFSVLAGGLVPLGYDRIYNPVSLTLYFVLLVCVFVIYAVCFRLLFFAHEKQAAQRDLAQAQHQMELSHEQYKRIHESIESGRRLRHDFRHHIVAVQGFLAAGESEKATDYLGQFVKTLDEHELGTLCANPVVNTVVGYYATLAKENGIVFPLRLDIPRDLAVEDSDLSVLLGNLLENAITAAALAPKEQRHMELHMLCSGKMLAITVDNSFDGTVKPSGSSYRSIKKNHTGIGLQSIERIAEKYGGGVEFTHDPFIFHASVMLNIG